MTTVENRNCHVGAILGLSFSLTLAVRWCSSPGTIRLTHSGAVPNEVVTSVTAVHCSAIEAGVGEGHIQTCSANWWIFWVSASYSKKMK